MPQVGRPTLWRVTGCVGKEADIASMVGRTGGPDRADCGFSRLSSLSQHRYGCAHRRGLVPHSECEFRMRPTPNSLHGWEHGAANQQALVWWAGSACRADTAEQPRGKTRRSRRVMRTLAGRPMNSKACCEHALFPASASFASAQSQVAVRGSPDFLAGQTHSMDTTGCPGMSSHGSLEDMA